MSGVVYSDIRKPRRLFSRAWVCDVSRWNVKCVSYWQWTGYKYTPTNLAVHLWNHIRRLRKAQRRSEVETDGHMCAPLWSVSRDHSRRTGSGGHIQPFSLCDIAAVPQERVVPVQCSQYTRRSTEKLLAKENLTLHCARHMNIFMHVDSIRFNYITRWKWIKK